MRLVAAMLLGVFLALMPGTAAPVQKTSSRANCGTCSCCVAQKGREALPLIPALPPPSTQSSTCFEAAEWPRALAELMVPSEAAVLPAEAFAQFLPQPAPLFAQFCSFLI